MANADLSLATRELFVRSLVDQVFMATPLIEKLWSGKKVTFKGGTQIERLMDTDTIDTEVQAYTANSALQDSRKTTLAKPHFLWKYAQLPLRYDVDEYIQNIQAGSEEQLLDLAEHLVKKGQRDMRLFLEKAAFNNGSATGGGDSGDNFESLVDALDHDTQYGFLTRTFSSSTNDWWQGADPAALNADVATSAQDTAYNLTIANLRKWIYESSIYNNASGPQDIQVLMCATLYNKLRAEMEAKMQYSPMAPTAKQGFTKMLLDQAIEVVNVPYLQTTSTMKTWMFIINWTNWELRIHPSRAMNLTDFEWQGKNANGHDYWLARIMLAGNLICWKPNSNMFLTAVS